MNPENFSLEDERWFYRDPETGEERDVTDEPFWWKCARGHEWQDIISNRVKEMGACPHCIAEKEDMICVLNEQANDRYMEAEALEKHGDSEAAKGMVAIAEKLKKIAEWINSYT